MHVFLNTINEVKLINQAPNLLHFINEITLFYLGFQLYY